MKYMKKGFSLLEILLVVAAIGILSSIVILAVNPGKQLAKVRNTERIASVHNILQAVLQYNLEAGVFPESIGTIPAEICRTDASNCNGLVDLSVLTHNQEYLPSLPIDPASASPNGTGYGIFRMPSGRITVTAPGAERGAIIEITQ